MHNNILDWPQDGYFDIESGCVSCDCNIAASSGPVCDKESPEGQCPCLPNIGSTKCTAPDTGYFFRHLDNELFEAEEATLSEVCFYSSLHCAVIDGLITLIGRELLECFLGQEVL